MTEILIAYRIEIGLRSSSNLIYFEFIYLTEDLYNECSFKELSPVKWILLLIPIEGLNTETLILKKTHDAISMIMITGREEK